MMTGCGPSRSGWVMKVVVWPSLVGISICWSIMGGFFYSGFRVFCLALMFIRLQGNHDMTRRLTREGEIGLEPRRPDRHCLTCLPVRSRPEISQDDPDQQSVFRRDRASDE